MVSDMMLSDQGLWRFALALYQSEGVADACITLQDGWDADVTLLLYGCWIGATRGIALSADDAKTAAASVEPWHDEVVRPLRALRRRLKSGPQPAPSLASDALRSAIKAAELQSERIELERLEELTTTLHPPRTASSLDAVAVNLSRFLPQYAEHASNPQVVAHIETIVAALRLMVSKVAS